MKHIYFYVPETHLHTVKQAMFAAGAGKIGHYDCCAWQTLGQGQFRPLAGSQAYIGKQDQVEYVDEYRVEMVCASEHIETVVAALKQAHPYEEIAYGVLTLSYVT